MTYIEKESLHELPRISDRVNFIYVEHVKISRQDGALTVKDQRGTIRIPAAMIGALFLGPGSDITHRAVELLGVTGTSLIWVGERGVRFYAQGRFLARKTNLLEKQAQLVSNRRSRLRVARAMYQMRFPNEDVSSLSMQQLRGREGARVRKTYRLHAERTRVPWQRREFDPDHFESSDPCNMALSAANVALYGVAHSCLAALGLSPGLGFVHTGHELAFVYDLADLYKAEITIPIAFDLAAAYEEGQDLGRLARIAVRDAMVDGHLLQRMVRDVQNLLEVSPDESLQVDILNLWDDRELLAPSGVNYEEF